MITSREQVTDLIMSSKVLNNITWQSVAKKVGLSREWVTSACLGQMALDELLGRKRPSV